MISVDGSVPIWSRSPLTPEGVSESADLATASAQSSLQHTEGWLDVARQRPELGKHHREGRLAELERRRKTGRGTVSAPPCRTNLVGLVAGEQSNPQRPLDQVFWRS